MMIKLELFKVVHTSDFSKEKYFLFQKSVEVSLINDFFIEK